MNKDRKQLTKLGDRVLEITKPGPVINWVLRIANLAEKASLATERVEWQGSPQIVAFNLVRSIEMNGEAIQSLEKTIDESSKSAHPFNIRGRPFRFEIELSGDSYLVEIEDTGSHASYVAKSNRTAGFSIQPVTIGQDMIIGLFFKDEKWSAQILGPKNSEVKCLEIKVL